MDFRRLQAFAKVYALRSFSRAGDDLLLSQPTISAHIMALEEELGTPLFDRLGRTVLPTQAGEVLNRYCTTIFTQLDHARADILALSKRVSGELIVGGSSIPAHYILPKLVSRYLARNPEVHVVLTDGDSMGIAALVADGSVHVGVIGAAAPQPELVSVPFLDDALILVTSCDRKIANLDGPDWRQRLVSLPWIMRESGSGTRCALEQALGAAGIDLRDIKPVLQVHSSLSALECAAAGLGVSAVSRLAAAPYLERGALCLFSAPGLDIRRQFFAVHHGRRSIFPALRVFLESCGCA